MDYQRTYAEKKYGKRKTNGHALTYSSQAPCLACGLQIGWTVMWETGRKEQSYELSNDDVT